MTAHVGIDYAGVVRECLQDWHFCGARDGEAFIGVCEDGHGERVALLDESDVAHCPRRIGTDSECRKVSYAIPGPGLAFIAKGAITNGTY